MITRQRLAHNSPSIPTLQHQTPKPALQSDPEEPQYRMHKFQIAVQAPLTDSSPESLMPLPELIQYISADADEERNCDIYERAEALEHCPFLTNDECSVCKAEGDLIICDSCP